MLPLTYSASPVIKFSRVGAESMLTECRRKLGLLSRNQMATKSCPVVDENSLST